MPTKPPLIKNQHSNSFFLRHRAVKITILLIGHFLGALIFTLLTFLIAEYIIGTLSAVIGMFFGGIWNNLKLNLLPPLIIGLSFVVLSVSNPIYALVSLILIFFSTALFLIGIHVEFLALIYIIIYIGAIAILFLFVIMMFNLKELQDSTTWHQNKDFLSISFIFYLFTLSKFYNIFLNLIFNYIEYDLYFNEVLTLKYELIFKQTQDWYTNFLQDMKQAFMWDTMNSKIFATELIHSHSQLTNNLSNPIHNYFLDTLHNWYTTKTDTIFPQNLETHLNWTTGIQQRLLEPSDIFLTVYSSPIDISIIGQVLYTYYGYLFFLATMILLIAMIGAIILALSTSEKRN